MIQHRAHDGRLAGRLRNNEGAWSGSTASALAPGVAGATACGHHLRRRSSESCFQEKALILTFLCHARVSVPFVALSCVSCGSFLRANGDGDGFAAVCSGRKTTLPRDAQRHRLITLHARFGISDRGL